LFMTTTFLTIIGQRQTKMERQGLLPGDNA